MELAIFGLTAIAILFRMACLDEQALFSAFVLVYLIDFNLIVVGIYIRDGCLDRAHEVARVWLYSVQMQFVFV